MIKNIAIIVLSLLVLISFVMIADQWRQGSVTSGSEPSPVLSANEESVISETSLKEPLVPPIDEATPELKRQESVVVPQQTAVAQEKSSEAPGNAFAAGLAEMMKNPEMKKMIRAQHRIQMDTMYGSLFEYLQLETERLDAFKDLLCEKQIAAMDIGLAMMETGLSSEDRTAQVSRMQEIQKEYDDRIKEFLGSDSYEVYEEFERTQPERMQVNAFNQTLRLDDRLVENQEHDLIRAMYEERVNFPFSTGLESQDNFDPSKLTEGTIGVHLQEIERLHEKYVSRAGSILTPAQLEQFDENLKGQLEMQKMAMKMAVQMFGGSAVE